MKISISPFVLLRIPQFSQNADIEQSWVSLKEAITESSPAFHQVIVNIDSIDLANATPKTQFTLWKYFNRAKYRGVPYGKFAGFGLAELEHRADLKRQLYIAKHQRLHSFPDWSHLKEIDKPDDVIFKQDRFIVANSSIYLVGNRLRFLYTNGNSFELAEVENEEKMASILAYCHLPTRYSDLRSLFFSTIDQNDLITLIKDMLDTGLLFTDLNPNIIGGDFYSGLDQGHPENGKTYILTERPVLDGNIDQSLFRSFPAYIDFLLRVMPKREAAPLNDFKKAFRHKYEQQEVDLLVALDPEIGLGYHQLESSSENDDLITALSARAERPRNQEKSAYDDKLRNFLLNAIYDTKGDKNVVIDIRNFLAAPSNLKPPNNFSALLHLSDNLVIPDSIGGCTANALSGRFTLGSEKLLTHCKATAIMESESNPDVIFFDIGYTAEYNVDNINRRREIYQHELMMLNFATSKELIPMNDLAVVLREDELILFSKKRQKRLVPRLSSAYNYKRSDLSIFRFLCDLQHQNIQSDLSFNIHDVLPGLNFYPRIQFNEIVVSAAQWLIFVNKSIDEQLESKEISRYFTAGTGDQTLRFDRENPADMAAFSQFAIQTADFYIREAFSVDERTVVDTNKASYHAQMQLTLCHTEQLYKPYHSAHHQTLQSQHKKIIPQGNNWVYFEIYCHSSRIDLLLTNQIPAFLEAYQDAFECYFFIRYNHPTEHLRFRIQMKDAKYGYFYISELMELLQEDIENGLITDVQIKPYIRELERYGGDLITGVEHFFELSSRYVLAILAASFDTDHKYLLCARLGAVMLKMLNLNPDEQKNTLKETENAFVREHQLRTTEMKLINKAYATIVRLNATILSKDPSTAAMEKCFNRLLKSCDKQRGIRLFNSLFHMHVNRIFSSQQRIHELIIYSFMVKDFMQQVIKGNRL